MKKPELTTNKNKCSLSKSEYPDCGCNECRGNVIGYLGKEKGKIYLYTGNFAGTYLHNQRVFIERFSPWIYTEKPSSCEAFICLDGGSGGQCDWIPREEIINNLI